MRTRIVLGSCLLALIPAVADYGQRGTGDQTGVARQANKPELVAIDGKIEGLKTGPCEMTTGRAKIGTHLLMKTSQGTDLNIHLGPVQAVQSMVEGLKQGTEVTVRGSDTSPWLWIAAIAIAGVFAWYRSGRSRQNRRSLRQAFSQKL